jgi:hypothetical protein
MPKLKCTAYAIQSDRFKREADYAFANSRIGRSRHHGQRGGDTGWTRDTENPDVYAVAEHFAEVIASRSRRREPNLKEQFKEHIERWKRETGHMSSIAKATSHPSYLRIIGLSRYSRDHQLEKLLLTEMDTEPDHWFAALTAITGENPVMPEDDFDMAVERWLDWGRARGII